MTGRILVGVLGSDGVGNWLIGTMSALCLVNTLVFCSLCAPARRQWGLWAVLMAMVSICCSFLEMEEEFLAMGAFSSYVKA